MIGPLDRGRSKAELLADVARSTRDEVHLAWVNRVYPARHPNLRRWLDANEGRASFRESLRGPFGASIR